MEDYAYWKGIVWSAETKLKLFGYRDIVYAWRKEGESYKSKKTISIQRHCGEQNNAGGKGTLRRPQKWKFCEGGRNLKERTQDDFLRKSKTVISKDWSK